MPPSIPERPDRPSSRSLLFLRFPFPLFFRRPRLGDDFAARGKVFAHYSAIYGGGDNGDRTDRRESVCIDGGHRERSVVRERVLVPEAESPFRSCTSFRVRSCFLKNPIFISPFRRCKYFMISREILPSPNRYRHGRLEFINAAFKYLYERDKPDNIARTTL